MKAVLWAAILVATAAAQTPLSTFGSGRISTQPQQPPTGKGLIEGTVVNAVTHEPMGRVQVTLGGNTNLNAITDAAGHFAFKDLAAGQFYLQAHSAGARGRVETAATKQVKLGAEDQVHDITLSVTPPGSISGHVVDEDGAPMASCNVTAYTFQYFQGQKTLSGLSSSNTKDTGEYQLRDLPAGKYYVQANCYREIPLPHAFMPRNSPDAPTLSYSPTFYPGSTDVSGATRVAVGPGADAGGTDFRMKPFAGVTLKGRILTKDDDALQGNVRLALLPRDGLNGLHQAPAISRFDKSTGKFQFRHIAPGSYELAVDTLGEGRPLYARYPVEVGTEQPDPIDVTLALAPSLSGSVQVEADSKIPPDSIQLMFMTRGYSQRNMPNIKVERDGTFTVPNIIPGKWQVAMNGVNGYIKSITLGEQEVTTDWFTISPGVPGQLKLVIGSKWASLDASVSSPPAEAGELFALIWPDVGRNQNQRVMSFDNQGTAHSMNMAPGHYHVCATEMADWTIFQNDPLLKKLESRCSSVDLEENGKGSVQLTVITKQDFAKLAAEVDN